MVVWVGLSNSQSIGYFYTTKSKRLKITTLKPSLGVHNPWSHLQYKRFCTQFWPINKPKLSHNGDVSAKMLNYYDYYVHALWMTDSDRHVRLKKMFGHLFFKEPSIKDFGMERCIKNRSKFANGWPIRDEYSNFAGAGQVTRFFIKLRLYHKSWFC